MEPLDLDRYTSSRSQDMLLTRRDLNGERELFVLLLRPCDEAVQKTIAFLVKDPHLTETVVLRAYLRAFKTLYRFYGQTSFQAWILSLALREAKQQKKELLTPRNGYSLTPEEWLSWTLARVARLRETEIAFCLGTNPRDTRRNLTTARKTIKINATLATDGKTDGPYKVRDLTSQIADLLVADSAEKPSPIHHELIRILSALQQEHKEHETQIPMDLEKEHRENLMLCTYIRLGFIKGVEMDRIRNYTAWYWQNHLLNHFRKEERIVFPALGRDHVLVKKALAQHRRLKRLFESKDDIHKMLSRIEEELLAHVHFEERVLFKEIKRTEKRHVLDAVALHADHGSHEPWKDQFWK